MLDVDDIHVYYGDSYVLQGVSLKIEEGEIVSLLGRNGVGKTTTLRAVLGHKEVRRGEITYRNENITNLPSYEIARNGIGWIPEERHIFPQLTVDENLTVAQRGGNRSKETVYEFLPMLADLKEAKGKVLSGGEQQMLALARGLLGGYDLLLVDEPTEGLAPVIIDQVVDVLNELKGDITMLIVGQNIEAIQQVADRYYVMDNGRIVAESDDIERDSDLIDEHVML